MQESIVNNLTNINPQFEEEMDPKSYRSNPMGLTETEMDTNGQEEVEYLANNDIQQNGELNSCQTSIKKEDEKMMMGQERATNDFSNLTDIHFNDATKNAIPSNVFQFKRYMANSGTTRMRTAKVRRATRQ